MTEVEKLSKTKLKFLNIFRTVIVDARSSSFIEQSEFEQDKTNEKRTRKTREIMKKSGAKFSLHKVKTILLVQSPANHPSSQPRFLSYLRDNARICTILKCGNT